MAFSSERRADQAVGPSADIGVVANMHIRICRVVNAGIDIGVVVSMNTRVCRVANPGTDIGVVANMDTRVGRGVNPSTGKAAVATMDTRVRRVANIDPSIGQVAASRDTRVAWVANPVPDIGEVVNVDTRICWFAGVGEDAGVALPTSVRFDFVFASRVCAEIADVPRVLNDGNTKTLFIPCVRVPLVALQGVRTRATAWNAFVLHRVSHVVIYRK